MLRDIAFPKELLVGQSGADSGHGFLYAPCPILITHESTLTKITHNDKIGDTVVGLWGSRSMVHDRHAFYCQIFALTFLPCTRYCCRSCSINCTSLFANSAIGSLQNCLGHGCTSYLGEAHCCNPEGWQDFYHFCQKKCLAGDSFQQVQLG